ncbi:unnamed protein product [Haemonchus placei]|uniref:Secreted protein n=1 Tax=Haemonchus placei TaxID=6290 RepID=A0A0N4WZ72_HAEPC|nr:unnamed protein product [Haemonchus placei]
MSLFGTVPVFLAANVFIQALGSPVPPVSLDELMELGLSSTENLGSPTAPVNPKPSATNVQSRQKRAATRNWLLERYLTASTKTPGWLHYRKLNSGKLYY